MPVPAGCRRHFIARPVIRAPGNHVLHARRNLKMTARADIVLLRPRTGNSADVPLAVTAGFERRGCETEPFDLGTASGLRPLVAAFAAGDSAGTIRTRHVSILPFAAT